MNEKLPNDEIERSETRDTKALHQADAALVEYLESLKANPGELGTVERSTLREMRDWLNELDLEQ